MYKTVLCGFKKNIHTPHIEGLGGWGGGSFRPKSLNKRYEAYWNFQRGGRSWRKSLSWGRYGIFLDLHITSFYDYFMFFL